MRKDELELLRLIHEEACTAFWSTRGHCGGDVSDNCQECYHYSQCIREKQIGEIFKELEHEPTM